MEYSRSAEPGQREAVTKFTITRSTWLRGEGSDDSYLLRCRDEQMCCLGHFGLACGINPPAMSDVCSPTSLAGSVSYLFPGWLLSVSPGTPCAELMLANDDQEADDTEREAKITKLFAEQGVQVEFVD